MNKKNSIKGLLVAFLFLATALQAFVTDTISVAVPEPSRRAVRANVKSDMIQLRWSALISLTCANL